MVCGVIKGRALDEKGKRKSFVLVLWLLTVSVLQAIACSGVRYLRWEVLKIIRKSRKHKS